MGVLVAGVDKKLLEHLSAETVLRQHPFYSPFDDGVRAAPEEVLGNLFLLPPGVAGKINVDLVFQFVASEYDLLRIDHNDKVATVNVRRVVGFVLAPKNGGDFRTHATDGLISTVHDVPVALNGSLVRVLGGEMQFAHFLFFLREAIAIPMAVKIMDRKSRPF
jgi:hypothetical protein